MKRASIFRKALLVVVGLSAAIALLWFFANAGPLAPVEVTVQKAGAGAVAPQAFGIGVVEARRSYKIGPTTSGRLRAISVDVGDAVHPGQVLGEMDPVDLEAKIRSQEAAVASAEAGVVAAEFAILELVARKEHAEKQSVRYEQLSRASTVSAEVMETKRQEMAVAEAAHKAGVASLGATRQNLMRAREELAALKEQKDNLKLVVGIEGLVVARRAEPGTTVVAGEPVLEVIDPSSIWINVRFDQIASGGLREGLPAQIVLRSRPNEVFAGKVTRIEPLADTVTEELLAKVVFDTLPEPLPPIGELGEVTVGLGADQRGIIIPNAALHSSAARPSVWVERDGKLRLAPVRVGAQGLDGTVQILDGLEPDAKVVVHSHRPLTGSERLRVVDIVSGGTR